MKCFVKFTCFCSNEKCSRSSFLSDPKDFHGAVHQATGQVTTIQREGNARCLDGGQLPLLSSRAGSRVPVSHFPVLANADNSFCVRCDQHNPCTPSMTG